jgi:hypothetical protein
MTVKELLIQEIESMTEVQLVEALDLIQSLKSKEAKPPHRRGSGKSVLRHVGKWVGNDLQDCLKMVNTSRGLAKF